MNGMNGIVRVSLPWATFGLVIDNDLVVRAAPVAKYTLGWGWAKVESYFLSRGATVEIMNDPR